MCMIIVGVMVFNDTFNNISVISSACFFYFIFIFFYFLNLSDQLSCFLHTTHYRRALDRMVVGFTTTDAIDA
jgi:hypothetical protein